MDSTEKIVEKIKPSLFGKLKQMCEIVTVEPIILAHVIPSAIGIMAISNLNLEKACRVNLNYEDHVCDALSARNIANYTLEEREVQKLVSEMTRWKVVIQSSLPCFLMLFMGAWSDKYKKRKFCILLPIFGEVLLSIGMLLNTYFFYELPMEVSGITETLLPALTGGWGIMSMAILSYVSDITTEETRTMRIGMAEFFHIVGIPIGTLVSGILLKYIGYFGVFSIMLFVQITGVTYGYIKIKDCDKLNPEEKVSGTLQKIQSFFDWRHVRDTISVTFKKGPNMRRFRISLVFIAVCLFLGNVLGEQSMMYLFVRFKFNWEEVAFSVFSSFSVITNILGTAFVVGFLGHHLKVDDSLLGIFAAISKIMACFLFAFAVTDWQLYLASILGFAGGSVFVINRSIASKMVSKDEFGKINSMLSIGETLMPMVFCPFYSTLYMDTMASMPGAFFLAEIGFLFPVAIIFGVIFCINRRLQESDPAQKMEDNV